MRFQIHSKFDPELAGQILRWIESTSGVSFNTSSDINNFTEVLRDGTVLCALVSSVNIDAVCRSLRAHSFSRLCTVAILWEV